MILTKTRTTTFEFKLSNSLELPSGGAKRWMKFAKRFSAIISNYNNGQFPSS
jgi:hypothetical protein